MHEILRKVLSVTLVVFIVGSLLELGLKLQLEEALGALRNVRFLVLSLVWSFFLCPAVAWSLTKIMPLSEPYALGMLLLGMAPCSPSLPKIASKAGGELAYVAAFMVLTAFGTVLFMPFAVPLLIEGYSASGLTLAKPLLFFIGLPLLIGGAIRTYAEPFADKARPIVKRVTDVDVIVLLGLVVWLFRKDYLGAVGTYAIATQLLFSATVGVGSYALAFGLRHGQKSVLALGVTTRNIGAALAPLVAAPDTDRSALVMCAVSLLVGIVAGAGGAKILSHLAPTAARGSKINREIVA